MTISSISSSSSTMGLLATMRTRAASGATAQAAPKGKPDRGEISTKLDADGSGGLDSAEVQSLTEKISEATGVSVDLSEFLATYDADGDGTLNEDETIAALEANRPQGPPPPSENGAAATEGLDSMLASAIEHYLTMAAMGIEGQGGGDLSPLLGDNSGSVRNIA